MSASARLNIGMASLLSPQPIRRPADRATIADDLRFITSRGTRPMAEPKAIRYPTVHLRGGSAIRRPLIVLAVCAVPAGGYRGRGLLPAPPRALVPGLVLTPVAHTPARLRLPVSHPA